MRLHQNVGTLDRAIRLVVSLVLAASLVAGLVSGPLAYGIGLVAVIMLVTGFCPLYAVFLIRTRPSQA